MSVTDTDKRHMAETSLALIGPTGGMGTFISQELVSQGCAVRAIVRQAGRVPPSEFVVPVVADVYDTGSLSRALEGVHTVVSAFNPGWDDPDLYTNYLRGARNIESACKTAGVSRLLIIGGASSLFDEHGRQLIDSFLPPEPYASGVRAARDHYTGLTADTDLDWVYLSPPMNCGPMGPVGRTGRYRVGGDHPVSDADGQSSLSREDLAVAVLDEVLRPAHHRERFTIGY